MDKIYIKDLEIYAYHGVNSEEKQNGQSFIISIELSLSLREAGLSDDLNMTVNYSDVCNTVEKVFTSKKYDLIEKCAEQIAEHILIDYSPVQKVEVIVKKPKAPIEKKFDYVAVEIERSWHTAYIGIGSNMGSKKENIKSAIESMNCGTGITSVLNVSKLYVTEPVGYDNQDDFLNGAVEIKTLLTPEELIKFLLNIEDGLGRERTVKWGPRSIDLDILLYDNVISSNEEVMIPHPRMHERLFVLNPLADIAPYLMHPVLNKRIIELRDAFHTKVIL